MPTHAYASSPSPPPPHLLLEAQAAEEDPDEEDADEEEEEEEEADFEPSGGHHLHHPRQRRKTPTPHQHHQHHGSPHRIQLRGLPPTPGAGTAEPSGRSGGVHSWGSASEDNLSSARSSVGSTSEGSMFTDLEHLHPSLGGPGGPGPAGGLQRPPEETGKEHQSVGGFAPGVDRDLERRQTNRVKGVEAPV